jgi:riboflavin synthase
MFTGIIQHKVRLLSLRSSRKGLDLTVEKPHGISSAFSEGESISINGICLTLLKIDSRTLSFFAQYETVRNTTLKSLRHGQTVNFERALTLGDRLGGHNVLGHVDGVAKIKKKVTKGASIRYEFIAPKNVKPYLIHKGSVALDGISLTISSLTSGGFTVDIIPASFNNTSIKEAWKPAALVNIEADVLGKQIHKSVEHFLSQKNFRSPYEP